MKIKRTFIHYAAILLPAMFPGGVCGQADGNYEVTTDVTARNVLLEEFTGIHCGFCPQGHAIAATLLKASPQVYVMAVHAGYYAQPYRDEPNFLTDEGTEINDEFGITGYPSGMVNREEFEEYGTPVTGRNLWTLQTKTAVKENAPVNLLMKSTYDGATRILKVHVEGYFTADSQPEQQQLCVAWTQDNIKGPQNGANMGSDYVHNHMLRGYITPVWGDTLDAPAKGTYFSRDYDVEMPAAVGDVKVVPGDMTLLAFVANGKGEVLNVTGGKPEYVNYSRPAGAVLSAPRVPVGADYGFRFFELFMTNQSEKPITGADFAVTVNGTVYNSTWSGTIAPFGQEEITVRGDWTFKDKGQNDFSVRLTAIDGESVEAEPYGGTFSSPIEATPEMTLKINTNTEAGDNTFTIRDADGTVVKTFGPYPDGTAAEYNETVALDADRVYCIDIADRWGDGIYSPRGYVTARSTDGSLIGQILSIDGFGTRCFFRTSKKATAITDVREDSADNYVEAYRADGTVAYRGRKGGMTLPAGIYVIRDRTAGTVSKIRTGNIINQ